MLISNNSKRVTEIDGLRGICAIAVMLFHYTFGYDQNWEAGKLFHYGYMGVPMFFIISGFVIYMSIESKKSYLDFCFSRFLRLYPIYWICLIITIASLLFMSIHVENLTWLNIVMNFTMLQRFLGFKDIDGAYWTLAVELVFYFFIVLMLLSNKTEKIIEVFLITIFALFFIRLILVSVFPESKIIEQITRQFRYFHLFLAGMVFYKIYKNGFTWYEILLLCICLLLNFSAQIRFNVYIETIIVCIFFAIFLIITSKHYSYLKILNSETLQFFGKISYPLYLLNEMFGISIFKFLQLNFKIQLPIQILIVCTVVILTSSIIHIFIEKPLFKYIKSRPNIVQNFKLKS